MAKRTLSLTVAAWDAIADAAEAGHISVSQATTALLGAYAQGHIPPPAEPAAYTERGSGQQRSGRGMHIPDTVWDSAVAKAGLVVDPNTGRTKPGKHARYRSMSALVEALGQALASGEITLAAASAQPAPRRAD
ncbi:hypothetical protein ACMATS_06450 [Streptoverticillium reticulum]|uniref:hypothetical protein n=1 Tax=Streptoverticillium reticulum TaxID=1433415 RepID=UPI0039BFE5D0